MCACTHMHMHVCMRACIHACYTGMWSCIFACVGVHVCVWVYIQVSTHMCGYPRFILGIFLNLAPSNVEAELNPDLAEARSSPFCWYNLSTCFVDFQVSAFQCSRMTYSLACLRGFYMYFKYINSSSHASLDVLYQLNHLHSPRFLSLNCKHFLYVLHTCHSPLSNLQFILLCVQTSYLQSNSF